jgi:hypothetical protein
MVSLRLQTPSICQSVDVVCTLERRAGSTEFRHSLAAVSAAKKIDRISSPDPRRRVRFAQSEGRRVWRTHADFVRVEPELYPVEFVQRIGTPVAILRDRELGGSLLRTQAPRPSTGRPGVQASKCSMASLR